MMKAFLGLHSRLPLRWHYAFGRFLAWCADEVFGYRKDVATVNLSRSFPEKSASEISEIRKRFYQHFGRVIAQTIWFGGCRGASGRERLRKSRLVEFENPQEWNRLMGSGRQMMVLLSHMGNWELIGGLPLYSYGEPLDAGTDSICVTYLAQSSKFWDSILKWNRSAPMEDLGFEKAYVEAESVISFVVAHRDEKYAHLFITDQHPYLQKGVFSLTFMNQECRSMAASAGLAVKLDMSVCYLGFKEKEDGGYTLKLVPICESAKGEDPIELMKQYYKLLENDLKEQPWNYLWTHNRWKKYD